MEEFKKNAGVILWIKRSWRDEYKRSIDPYNIVFCAEMSCNAVIS